MKLENRRSRCTARFAEGQVREKLYRRKRFCCWIRLASLFFLLFRSAEVWAQHQVSGTVRDAGSGEPLPGVNVVVKGTTLGTATDLDGRYRLVVPSPQDTLVFSFVGYETREEPIAGPVWWR